MSQKMEFIITCGDQECFVKRKCRYDGEIKTIKYTCLYLVTQSSYKEFQQEIDRREASRSPQFPSADESLLNHILAQSSAKSTKP
ncbi:MAG: hypothetical protein AABY22_28170 [Nanoarchaeota archaeon]